MSDSIAPSATATLAADRWWPPAILSPCQRYRYLLSRSLDFTASGTLLLLLHNPSKADASLDDPTVRKAKGFANRLGFEQLAIINPYAYRATDPRDLRAAMRAGADIVGPDNDAWIAAAAEQPGAWIVAGWGGMHKSLRWRVRQLLDGVLAGRELWCWGITKDGQPRHPLMLPYATELRRWAP